MQFVWKYVDDLMGKGLEFTVILELLIYATANLVPLALPLGILLASIMTFGNLAEHYELVAMKSAGNSLLKIMFPLTTLATFLTIGAFLFANYVAPTANLKFKTLLYDITEQKPTLELKEKIFYNGIEGYSIRIDHKDTKTNELFDVLIYDHSDQYGGNRKVIKAERGTMLTSSNGQYLIFTLFNGISYEELSKTTRVNTNFPLIESTFEEQEIVLDLSGFNFKKSDENLFKQGYQMLNIGQLKTAVDSLDNNMALRQEAFNTYLENSLLLTRIDSLKIGAPSKFDSSYFALSRHALKSSIDLAENLLRNAKSYAYRSIDEQEVRKKQQVKYNIEYHRKFTLSFACLILFFVGAPLGAIIKKGGLGMPVVFAVIFFLVFHILSITGEKMSIAYVFTPIQGMWLASFILAPISVFLTIKANADSALFDRTAYIKIWKKLWRKK